MRLRKLVKVLQIFERSMKGNWLHIKGAGLKYALKIAYYFIVKFCNKNLRIHPHFLLFFSLQEKDGNKDLSVPGAGVYFLFMVVLA